MYLYFILKKNQKMFKLCKQQRWMNYCNALSEGRRFQLVGAKRELEIYFDVPKTKFHSFLYMTWLVKLNFGFTGVLRHSTIERCLLKILARKHQSKFYNSIDHSILYIDRHRNHFPSVPKTLGILYRHFNPYILKNQSFSPPKKSIKSIFF